MHTSAAYTLVSTLCCPLHDETWTRSEGHLPESCAGYQSWRSVSVEGRAGGVSAVMNNSWAHVKQRVESMKQPSVHQNRAFRKTATFDMLQFTGAPWTMGVSDTYSTWTAKNFVTKHISLQSATQLDSDHGNNQPSAKRTSLRTAGELQKYGSKNMPANLHTNTSCIVGQTI